ncbi:DUF742 domain-containing protein [Streptomyces sp. NPDC050204]|uniref:DUF742 domain-containing protein n=1 Tax=Streptomyces sp. NPDC050204 TaxID=3155514 RepID=UPI0034296CEF
MSPQGRAGARLVRAYVITDGRAYAARNHFDVITLISLSASRLNRGSLNPEQRQILDLLTARGALSVAEIGALLSLPVSVVRILLADLMEAGHITPRRRITDTVAPDRSLLEAVLAGLERL